MRHAIIMYGPSGSGKTTLSKKIIEEYHYKHCNTDEFRFIFSNNRSRERSAIAAKLTYTYAKELVKRKYDLIVESLHEEELQKLKRFLRKEEYVINEISLVAKLQTCLANNKKRKKPFTAIAIKEAHKHYSFKRGLVLDVDELGLKKIYNIIIKEVIKKKPKKKT